MNHGFFSITATPPMCLLAGSARAVLHQVDPGGGGTRLQSNTTLKRKHDPAGAVGADNTSPCLRGTRTTVSTFQ